MLDSVIIIGLVIAIVQILKGTFTFFGTNLGSKYIPLIVLFMAGLFNVLNGVLFGGDPNTSTFILGYLREGLIIGAISSGIYSMGKTYLNTEKG